MMFLCFVVIVFFFSVKRAFLSFCSRSAADRVLQQLMLYSGTRDQIVLFFFQLLAIKLIWREQKAQQARCQLFTRGSAARRGGMEMAGEKIGGQAARTFVNLEL